MTNTSRPKIKVCPICGSIPIMKVEDMGRPNGRGYPGCFSYTISCPHCDLPKHVGSDTVCHDPDTAHRLSRERWNEEVDRIQAFLDNK